MYDNMLNAASAIRWAMVQRHKGVWLPMVPAAMSRPWIVAAQASGSEVSNAGVLAAISSKFYSKFCILQQNTGHIKQVNDQF